MENIKVALCVIARLENKYIKEYVKYYKSLGFDKIFIYDNNRPEDNEKITDEISAYVDTGLVDVIDWPVFEGDAQLPAYQDCFDKHKDEYDWIAFFDSDEYLTYNGENFNIKEFLSNPLYNDFGGVAIPNYPYDDNDVIINDSKSRLTVYTKPSENKNIVYIYKTIVKCKNNNVIFNSPKSTGFSLPYMESKCICNYEGNLINWNELRLFTYDGPIFIKNIKTGCIDDFINIKQKRKWPNSNLNKNFNFDLFYFFQYNNFSEEKVNYYNTHIYK